MNDAPFDIVIAGGGLVGASLALALAGYGGRVALVERREAEAGAGGLDVRTTALAHGSRRVLETLGVWPAVSAGAAPIEQIHVSDRGHFGAARLSAAEHGLPALGYVVENHELQRALDEALDGAAGVERVAGTLETLEQQPACVELAIAGAAGCRRMQAKLLAVAAGAASALADDLGLHTRERRYGQAAVVANVVVSRPRPGVAFERFTRYGPLAALPLGGGSGRYAIVMSVAEEQRETLLALPDAGFLERLQAVFGRRLGRFVASGRRAAFDLALTRARQPTGRRTVLLGNAARALHPVAGQGFNLALRDVAALAALLRGQPAGADPGAQPLLERFVRSRAGDHLRTTGLTDALVTVFSNRCAPLVAARGAGLLALDLLPPLRRAFARQAMGIGV